ncbi:PDZ domain-containing protein [Sanyastnella coralliicola]|uniref:PDZ domain-containing protein n=1 Tax=Sanyastnella coralliicola TaxID=3069118 RepID=UPI0027BA02DD|nr:PDZ domain-containing protein [Longitalea sp. SCSIO 12813]
MRYQNLLKALFVLLAVFAVSFSQAQDKATVKIKKESNGEVEELEKEINLQNGDDIEAILKELDILDEFGNLEEGQAFEITVRKLNQNGEEQNYDLSFYPEKSSGRAFLGVYVDTANGPDGTRGARVSGIIDDTAASESDLQEGDIITKVGKYDVNSYDELVEAIKAHKPDEKVTIKYNRDGNEEKTKVTFGERPVEEIGFPWSGESFDFNGGDFEINLDNLYPDKYSEENFFKSEDMEERSFLGVTPGGCGPDAGVMLGSVIEGSSAESAGLEAGDLIKRFNGDLVHNWDELVTAIRGTSPGDQVTIEYRRGQNTMTTTTEIGSREYHNYEGLMVVPNLQGVDELGGQLYDMEIHLDDLGEGLEGLMESLEGMDEFGEGLDELMQGLEELSLAMERPDGFEVDSEVSIRLEIDNVTEEDMAIVNENADTKLRNANDLDMSNISFFPNPSSGQFALQFTLPANDPVRVMIYDQMGSLVYDEQINDFDGQYRNMLDLSDQADGVYYMQLMQGDKTYSKKLVKGS